MSDGTATRDKSFGPQGQRRRTELMEATVRLTAGRGFAKTRVSDIVGEVGVGQGVFYWYFESKDALFQEILIDTTHRLRLFQAAFIAGENDPVRRIAKGILASLEFIAHNRHAFAFIDHASIQARLRERRTEALRTHVVDTIPHLAEAMEEGRVRSTDADYPSHAIAGVVDRLARAYARSMDSDIDRVAQEAIDFCVGGMLGARTFEVADLRSDVEMTDELIEIRDRLGAGSAD